MFVITRDQARLIAERRILNGIRAYNLSRSKSGLTAAEWFALLEVGLWK